MRVLFVLFLTVILASAWRPISAQTLSTNDAGERILVYPDGSWRYFSDVLAGAPNEPSPITSPVGRANAEVATSPEEEARARSSVRNDVKDLKRLAKQQRKALDKNRKVERKELDRLNNLREEGAAVERAKLDIANRRLQSARTRVSHAETKLAATERQARTLEQTLTMTRAQRAKYLASNGGLVTATQPIDETPLTPTAPTQTTESITVDQSQQPQRAYESAPLMPSSPVATQTSIPAPRTEAYAKYAEQNDPRVYPPETTCTIAATSVDPFTKKRRQDLAQQVLFAHTNPDAKRAMGDESMISALATLSDIDGQVVLNINYVIRSQYAAREFGALPKGANLTLSLVEGGNVQLRNTTLAQPEYDPVDKVTRYATRYPLPRSAVKTLSKSYLDEVRVTWGTGFEDYAVYDIDFFRRQLACF